ncbi:Lipoxygenase-likey domain-containing protein 1 [Holothuria leucospilota]|uniref:Lipoxygenase-likey domain-containing protein 1 n=1 Tax=Holothuria leucospilota TaxID=206669 RepID=A0A9Q0YG91_HOLLE|nr:Lipoxygenase-likey domain-containing protein 1 [Holothuria leucospilota]
MGDDPKWFLAHVEVEAPSLSKVLHFPYHKMLPDRDGKTEGKLRPVETHEKETYHISVKTADVKGAGTNSKVYIKLFGKKGVTGLKFLENPVQEGDKFERGNTDVFILHNVKNVGAISRVRIGHDNSGSYSGWLLAHVEIASASLKKTLFFPCNMWLADNEGDGKTERELEPVEKHETETYHVYVRTADFKGAGTDCKVYINLIGENGQTGDKETYYVSVKTADVRGAGTNSKVHIQLFGKKGVTGQDLQTWSPWHEPTWRLLEHSLGC